MTDRVLIHYGTKRHSGRYPWGSGGELLSSIDKLQSKGLSEVEVAAGLGISTGELRNQKSIAKAQMREDQRLNVIRQKESGMSVAAISREFNIPAGTVRDLLKPNANMKFQIIQNVANKLRETLEKWGFVDVGEGTEVWVGVSETKLKNAVTLLRNEGHPLYYLDQEQLGTGKTTTIKVLGTPDSTFGQLVKSKGNIGVPQFFTKDKGFTFFEPADVENFSSDRVLIKYKKDGGGDKDGLIEMRRGVPELNLGDKAYAQVRIGVDGTHFMKGMAVLRDDIPKGYDVVYYSSKDSTGNKLDAMKPQVESGTSANSKFGAVVRPNQYEKDGKEVFGVVNILGKEKPAVEGSWSEYNKNLSSQILSKQAPRLAAKQLDITYKNSKAELDEILTLTNPVVRNHLLTEFGDKADRAAIDLKAAALPRQNTHVLLPDPKLKPNEVYAPNYDNGETVVLVRHPHGGIFEIPTLKVNNKTSEYRKIIGADAPDAVAVHPSVAQKLSGADYDGDTVLVIPNKKKEIRTAPSLEGLKDFDAQSYKIPKEVLYDKKKNPSGIKPMTENQKQIQMGIVSNLITDMTIQGAPHSEIARAVRHSMVVIDAEKHELNYKQSYIDNGVSALKKRYQYKSETERGAATLISKTKSELRVPQRHDHYNIDPKTGEKKYIDTYKTWINPKTGVETPITTKTTKGAYAKDAHKLSSGTVIEKVYADHANKMKGLGNQARLATLGTKPMVQSPQAKRTYSVEIDSLDAKYKAAVRHRPIERKAQLIGGQIYSAKLKANPDMNYATKKKAKGDSLALARARLGSPKPTINITPREWEAIEMGGVSGTRLKGVLRNADMDVVRKYATPRAIKGGISPAKQTRAKALLNGGYTNAEVAAALGVPVSQIQDIGKR